MNWVVQLGGHSLSRNNTPDKMREAGSTVDEARRFVES